MVVELIIFFGYRSLIKDLSLGRAHMSQAYFLQSAWVD